MTPSKFFIATAILVALCASQASASWLNQTALAAKINATLAAKGSQSQPTLISKLQSAIASKASSVDLAESYLVGNRTKPDFTNATTLSGLIDYTRGRLAFEAQLKSGSAFSTGTPAAGAAAAANNIVCYVDPTAGTVLNVIQGNIGSCTAGGTPVTIPTAGKFVTRLEMAIDKQLPLVGRLNFFVQDTLDSKPTVYTCGYAGGEAISLFPKGYVVSSLPIGCEPLTPAALGRRRLSQTSKLAVNPELVNPVVASAAAVAAVAAAGGSVSPAVAPTGVVQAPGFSVPAGSLSAGSLASISTANSFPTPPVVTPFGNGTNSTNTASG